MKQAVLWRVGGADERLYFLSLFLSLSFFFSFFFCDSSSIFVLYEDVSDGFLSFFNKRLEVLSLFVSLVFCYLVSQ